MTERQKLEFDLKLVEDNIKRAAENIDIFSAQVRKHQEQKLEFEILRRELVEKLKKVQD
jgi:hypothetical protein